MATGFVSADHRRLALLSAGHPLPVLLANDEAGTLVADTCPPLGLFSEDQLGEPTFIDLPDTWALLMFTDGLFEGHVKAGAPERLGVDRIEQWCRRLGGKAVDETHLDGLLNFVETANGGPIVDDIAVLLLASARASGKSTE